jgi:hypothetical protein
MDCNGVWAHMAMVHREAPERFGSLCGLGRVGLAGGCGLRRRIGFLFPDKDFYSTQKSKKFGKILRDLRKNMKHLLEID